MITESCPITALAPNTTLDPRDPDYEWVDRGPLITSTPGQKLAGGLALNAIDACFSAQWSGCHRSVGDRLPDGFHR